MDMQLPTKQCRMAYGGSSPLRGTNWSSKSYATLVSQYEWFDSHSSGEVILALAAVGKSGKAAILRISCLEVQVLSAVQPGDKMKRFMLAVYQLCGLAVPGSTSGATCSRIAGHAPPCM